MCLQAPLGGVTHPHRFFSGRAVERMPGGARPSSPDLYRASCPRAAVTNYHKLSGFRQEKCNLSQLWKPEVWNQDVSRGCAPSEGPREESFLVSSSF